MIDVYIARVGWKCSRPCHTCRKFLRHMSKKYSIRKIIFTDRQNEQPGTTIIDVANI